VVVGAFHVLPGFWCGGGLAAGVGGPQRDRSGRHQAKGADEQGPLESVGEHRSERDVEGQQVADAAANTFGPGRSYRVVPIRANGQSAFGTYLADPHTGVFRA